MHDWFRDEQGVSSEPSGQPEKASEFYTLVFDQKFDLLPAAREVVSRAKDITISAEKLAEYAMKYGDGAYIKKIDIPVGLDAGILRQLIDRTARWARWPYRRDQLVDPDLQRFHSHVELHICDLCEPIIGFQCKALDFVDIVRIPLRGVPIANGCSCSYRAVRKAQC